MPLTSKGEEIKAEMQKEYGAKKGESVFYASANKGTIKGVDGCLPGLPVNISPEQSAEYSKARNRVWGGV